MKLELFLKQLCGKSFTIFNTSEKEWQLNDLDEDKYTSKAAELLNVS